MSRLCQLLFVAALLAVSWFAMMAVHELGHVLGAVASGSHVERVVLHPLSISRTDVSPNLQPGLVVWLGPIVGCLLPLALFALIPRRLKMVRNLAQFFAGFCMIANGAYISIGSLDRVGDCGEMLRTGTPLWVMIVFGVVAMMLGIYLWHRLGSLKTFFQHPTMVTPRMVIVTVGLLMTILAVEWVLFSH